MGYKFDRFDFMVSSFPFCILPSVKVIVNDLILCQKNISVVSEWLCFHFRWRWLKEQMIGGAYDR